MRPDPVYTHTTGWYTPREIGKRAVIFWVAGAVGQMFSGFLQAAAYTNLNGVHGLAGWRWLFIIDAIITLPIALFGFFFLPGLPLQDKKEWWLTEDEHQLAIDRLKRVGRKGRTPWTWDRVKALFTTWHIYVLPFVYIFWNNGTPQPTMGYYLKSFNAKNPPVPGRHYTVQQINNLPLPGTAFFIVASLILAWLSDGLFRGRRWPIIYIGIIITLPISATLRVLPLYDNIKAHFGLYWISNVGQGAGPLILAWINEINSHDSEKRALLVALANDLTHVVQAVGPNFYWKTTDFPAARKGWLASIIYQCLLAVWTTLVLFLLHRDKKKAALDKSSELQPSDAEAASVEGDDKDVKLSEARK